MSINARLVCQANVSNASIVYTVFMYMYVFVRNSHSAI